MAKLYDISLLPVITEQAEFYLAESATFSQFVRDSYEQFLSSIDEKSEQYQESDSYDRLQQLYTLVAARYDVVMTALAEGEEDITAVQKELADIAKKNDIHNWNILASELIEHGEYCANTQEFKASITQQISEMRSELTEILHDWNACIEEGRVQELVLLLEALADEQSELFSSDADEAFEALYGRDDVDDYQPQTHRSLTSTDDDEEDDFDDVAHQEASGCCSDANKANDRCCGRQTPCCKQRS